MTTWRNAASAVGAVALLLAAGCGDGDGGGDGGGTTDAAADARADGGGDAGARPDGATDGGGTEPDAGGSPDAGPDGGPPPVSGDVPGGPPGAAPVVGCEDAERPARRLDAPEEVCEAVAPARCFYVDPDGDDANDGTFAAPLATPQAAARRAGPGDVIYLRGGVYGERNGHVAGVNRWDDPSAGVRRGLLTLGRVALPGWAGGETYVVGSGTAEAPITVRSYPGERACADGVGAIRIGSVQVEVAHWRIEGITLRGAPINIGGGSGDAERPTNQVHDIEVRFNEVYLYQTPGGGNPGLVRVGRGDGGGPYRILVESNILHDIVPVDDGVVRDWRTTTDAQHYGAVTTLSCETYRGVGCGGNGELVVRNNHIYHVPQAFFLKNPAEGPFLLEANVIHDALALGKWAPSNITFRGNLVFRVGGSIRLGGSGGPDESEGVYLRMGRNLAVVDNTFVGFDRLVFFRIYASGHTFRRNVVQGLSVPLSAGSWDDIGLIAQGISWVRPDPATALEASQLATDNDFDDNCYVPAVEDFIAYGRRYRVDGETRLDHLTLAQARERLGFDASSTVAGDPAAVFEDFEGGDYRLREGGPCGARGARVPAWWRP